MRITFVFLCLVTLFIAENNSFPNKLNIYTKNKAFSAPRTRSELNMIPQVVFAASCAAAVFGYVYNNIDSIKQQQKISVDKTMSQQAETLRTVEAQQKEAIEKAQRVQRENIEKGRNRGGS